MPARDQSHDIRFTARNEPRTPVMLEAKNFTFRFEICSFQASLFEAHLGWSNILLHRRRLASVPRIFRDRYVLFWNRTCLLHTGVRF